MRKSARLGLTHQAFLYERDDDLLRTVVPFMREGVASRDVVLAVSSARGVARLRRALGAAANAVEFGDSASWYAQPTRTIAAYNAFVAKHVGRRLRVVAEGGWQTRSATDIGEWTRYEAIVNQAFEGVDALVLCLYDRRITDPRLIDGALHTHPELVDGVRVRPNYAYLTTSAVHLRIDREPLPPPPADAVTIPVDAGMASMRAALSGHARGHDMSRHRLNELLVATTEVVTNGIRHGRPPVGCQMWADGDDMVVDVTDAGSWCPADVPGYLPPDSAARSGFGLWGTRMLCSLVQIRTGVPGTDVRLRVPRG